MKKNIYSFKLTDDQQKSCTAYLKVHELEYKEEIVPYTSIAVSKPNCRINLYTSGKLVVQGKSAEEWVTFVLEPQILEEIVTGYDELLNPEEIEPHIGIDESGKGDFFGPLVIASCYTTKETVEQLKAIGVKDSKSIKSDAKMRSMAREIKKIVGNNYTIITIGNPAYNRMYAKIGNLNRLLAWGHAKAIEGTLEKVPDCPKAISDKFGPTHQIQNALQTRGQKIELIQRTKAESDCAVAAASILARAQFVESLMRLEKKHKVEFAKGVSQKVLNSAAQLISENGAPILIETAKLHFKTTDKVLASSGKTRADLEA